jgi:RNA polymerase sigma-70 factor (ECF subfamily)
VNSADASTSKPTESSEPVGPSSPKERTIDAELLAQAAQGDTQAFRKLVERHQRRAHAVAFGLVRHHEDALEIVQEAFIRVFKHRAEFAGQASFSTWLYRIVFNLSIDQLRKRSPNKTVDFDDEVSMDGAATEWIPRRSEVDPWAQLDRKRLVMAVQAALDQLPAIHRAVILLRELEGFSYEEMAETLEVSKGTIMSRLFHARKKLQKLLREALGDEAPAEWSAEAEGTNASSTNE